MFREAAEAGNIVRAQITANAEPIARITRRLRERPPVAVVTCARGSSDHAATYAKYLIESRIGAPTASAALSISSVYAKPQALGGMLYLAISQSGKSPDLLASVEAAKAAGAVTIALSMTRPRPWPPWLTRFCPSTPDLKSALRRPNPISAPSPPSRSWWRIGPMTTP